MGSEDNLRVLGVTLIGGYPETKFWIFKDTYKSKTGFMI